jgi:DUF1680 family protein
MDLSETDLQQFAEADRREVDPPIQVQTAHGRPEVSSIGGSKSVSSGSVVYAVRTGGNAGSKLLIFAPRAAHSE